MFCVQKNGGLDVMIEKKNNHFFFVGLSVGLLCTRIGYMLLSSLMMCFNKLFICLSWSHLYAVILFAQQQKNRRNTDLRKMRNKFRFCHGFKNLLTYLKKINEFNLIHSYPKLYFNYQISS